MVESDDQLYVSIGRPVYRGGKAKELQCQQSLLRMMKHFANLHVLWKEKKQLRNQVSKVLSETVIEINKANTKMPIPKAIAKRMEAKKREEEKILRQAKKEKERIAEAAKRKKVVRSKSQTIDDELKEIQQKLQTLNR